MDGAIQARRLASRVAATTPPDPSCRPRGSQPSPPRGPGRVSAPRLSRDPRRGRSSLVHLTLPRELPHDPLEGRPEAHTGTRHRVPFPFLAFLLSPRRGTRRSVPVNTGGLNGCGSRRSLLLAVPTDGGWPASHPLRLPPHAHRRSGRGPPPTSRWSYRRHPFLFHSPSCDHLQVALCY